MNIDLLMGNNSNTIYYNLGFRAMLEDHMTWLRNHPNTTRMDLTTTTQGAMNSWRYEADFYGLLTMLSIPRYLHWLCLRMMDMTNPMQMPPDMTYILIPPQSELDQLVSAYKTTNGIN